MEDVELGELGGTRGRKNSLEEFLPAPTDAKPPLRVVVAVNDSSGAQTAFVRAVELLEKNRNPNSLLYTLATRALPARWGTALLQEDAALHEEELRAEKRLRHMLNLYEDQLKGFNFRHRSGISRGDDVAAAIVKRCEELKADLLVVGRRNISTVKRTITGSVSDYCASNASMSVMIVDDKD